jgi:hypothetical protein
MITYTILISIITVQNLNVLMFKRDITRPIPPAVASVFHHSAYSWYHRLLCKHAIYLLCTGCAGRSLIPGRRDSKSNGFNQNVAQEAGPLTRRRISSSTDTSMQGERTTRTSLYCAGFVHSI